MNTLLDEAEELRHALRMGIWQQLMHPLLPLLLLGEAGEWWQDARRACAEAMRRLVQPTALRAPLDVDGEIALGWVRLQLDQGKLPASMEPHVRVLEQWPAP